MKTCPKCKTQHSNQVMECPHCGTPLEKKSVNKFAVIIPVAVVYLIAMTVAILYLTRTVCVNHDFIAATCTHASECKYCGESVGEPLGHDWEVASCAKAATCKRCNEVDGKPLDHVPGEWITIKSPTIAAFGREERSCTVCKNVIDGRTLDKKIPQVVGNSFNFNDTEFIEWLRVIAPIDADIDTFATSEDGYTYPITHDDGESGIVMINCASQKKSGNVRAIIFYFDDVATAIELAAIVGENIAPSFSSNDAMLKMYAGKPYSQANMTALLYDADGLVSAVVAPTIFLRSSDILD